MLVLARRENQKLYIGDNITVTVLRLSNGTVRLGVEAPREVQVLRDDAKNSQPHYTRDEARETEQALLSPPPAPIPAPVPAAPLAAFTR